MQSLSDVKIVGRALVKGWLNDFDDRKRKAVQDMFDVVENSQDDKMKVEAFAALVRAGEADRKRDELELKKQALDDAKRFRLLELIKHVPLGTLAEIASGHSAAFGTGRQGEGCDTEGESEGIRT